MTTDHDVMRRYAWRLYLRRLDAARETVDNCHALGGPAPDWAYDRDQMQRDAWREARRFVATGSGSTATCAGECATLNDRNGDCPAMSPDGYYCTRERGHAGLHEACGFGPEQHPIERWEDNHDPDTV